ncbi:Sec-independent protein translocase protein TatB [Rhizorhabdus phycosphaerae]|uniref:Sec-independent protein translocase protein TatB n=1 Tax=Rhizorhabdus phycosphaerae TaxID=2711156 RepID=UPI0013EB371D|nr:Sec-independent protein translocase protein TatB [Rhizorhabdus phycosphaerae]
MLDIAPTELLLVAVVALVVIGPKDLPKAMRVVGQWIARARGVARHFRSGIDEMIRQSELEEMEKKWAAENERIMREHPPQASQHTDQQPSSHDDGMIPVGSQPALLAESSEGATALPDPDVTQSASKGEDFPASAPQPRQT